MAQPKQAATAEPEQRLHGAPTPDRAASTPQPVAPAYATVMEEARRVGLLDGGRSEHVSFRAPPALIEAAKRETGVTSTSELGILALALLAQPDPVVAFFKRTRGRLGKDHALEC